MIQSYVNSGWHALSHCAVSGPQRYSVWGVYSIVRQPMCQSTSELALIHFPNAGVTALSLWADFHFFFSPHINTAGLFALSKHIFVKSETFPPGFSQREWSCQSSSSASARSHFHLLPLLWFCWRLYCKVCWKIDNCTHYSLSLFSSLCCVMMFGSNLTKERCVL